MIQEKAMKHLRNDTILFIALTAYSPSEKDQVIIPKNYPNVRVVSAEFIFRFLDANIAAIEKVRKCCDLTRRKKINALEGWALLVKKGQVPSFLDGQVNLNKWLKQIKRVNLRRDIINIALNDTIGGNLSIGLQTYLQALREEGRDRIADFLLGTVKYRMMTEGVNREDTEQVEQTPIVEQGNDQTNPPDNESNQATRNIQAVPQTTKAATNERQAGLEEALKRLQNYSQEHPQSSADNRLPPDIRADLDFLENAARDGNPVECDREKAARDSIREVEEDMEYLDALARGEHPQTELPKYEHQRGCVYIGGNQETSSSIDASGDSSKPGEDEEKSDGESPDDDGEDLSDDDGDTDIQSGEDEDPDDGPESFI